MKNSLEFFGKGFEDLTAEVKAIRKENAEIRAENASLASELGMLKKRMFESDQRILQLEQYSRNRNLEIKGIPVTDTESAPEILDKIGKAINEPITKGDVEACHRVPTREKSQSNIVVQFVRRAKRDEVLSKAKKVRFI